ncbi:hypothetical protein SAMN04488028_10297 [Reichenbachiella agariperforans]|uniref:Uncharacterized protein n=1 Tax=Reichenbachiella agariperforans TaxID=156994 RepID=A0A1M6N4H7_REIAG|nr:hypothetical protein SAMN04488028_10297 [Reichenbachiella agariperforans]
MFVFSLIFLIISTKLNSLYKSNLSKMYEIKVGVDLIISETNRLNSECPKL